MPLTARTARLDKHPISMPSFADRTLVDVELNSPDRILARSEPWHESDKDTDRHLDPANTAETLDLAGLRSIPPDALLILLRFLIPCNFQKHRWRQAQIRLAVLAHIANLDGIGGMSFTALAEELDCTRALLSLRSLEMIDGLQIEKTRNGKRRSTRDTYRKTATEAHARAGHRMAVGAGQITDSTDMR